VTAMRRAKPSLCPAFTTVDEHVARHPVTRAVARRNLDAAVRDFRIRLHLLAEGELVKADGLAAARVLAVAIRVMRGGMEAVVGLSARKWRWRTADAVAIDTAIGHARAVVAGATALEQQAAHRYVIALEREVEAAHATTAGG